MRRNIELKREESVAGEVCNMEFESEYFLLQCCPTEIQWEP